MARDQKKLSLGKDAKWWQKLFGLEEKRVGWAPPIRPGHSATGEVVTGRAPDWSRYDECMKLPVVGESYRQAALVAVSDCPPNGEHGYECSAELVPEPDNEHDKFAVKVIVKGQHVGYLSKGNARRYSKRIQELNAAGSLAICMAYIGRQDGGPLGVSLRLPYDGEILQNRA